MNSQLIAEAQEKVRAAITACNKAARSLMAEASPFAAKNAEKILAADISRLRSLAMDLDGEREGLAVAVAEYEALKRRAQ